MAHYAQSNANDNQAATPTHLSALDEARANFHGAAASLDSWLHSPRVGREHHEHMDHLRGALNEYGAAFAALEAALRALEEQGGATNG